MKEEISFEHKPRIKVNIGGKDWWLTETQYNEYKKKGKLLK